MTRTFTPSHYQQAVFDWALHGSGHGLVLAVAGAGKSSTLAELVRQFPTEVQRRTLVLAFNKGIVTSMGARFWAQGIAASASTLHSLGKSCLTRPGLVIKDAEKQKRLASDGAIQALGNTDHPAYVAVARQIKQLVHYARLTRAEPVSHQLRELVDHYQLEEMDTTGFIWEATCIGVERAIQQSAQLYLTEGLITFDDMICLPTEIEEQIRIPHYPWILVDEAQDLNAAQLELILAASSGGRILCVGDERQAIYGFSGADTQSIAHIRDRLHATVLPLSICYRCDRLIIEQAQQVCAQIEPVPGEEGGTVSIIQQGQLAVLAQPGDAIIGRTTAPLVDLCFTFLRKGIRAQVRGRDIGKSMQDLIKELTTMPGYSLATLEDCLEAYHASRLAVLAKKKTDTEMEMEALRDRVETIRALYESYTTHCDDTGETPTQYAFHAYIETLFTDDEQDASAILLMTIHKAKGLEFDTVFILPKNLPHPKASGWQQEQEMNLLYVAITRAKHTLHWVGSLPSGLTLPGSSPEPMPVPCDNDEEERRLPLDAPELFRVADYLEQRAFFLIRDWLRLSTGEPEAQVRQRNTWRLAGQAEQLMHLYNTLVRAEQEPRLTQGQLTRLEQAIMTQQPLVTSWLAATRRLPFATLLSQLAS